ncbi:MAG: hypothetical protein ACOCQR_03550 [bacterium]
MGKDLSATFAVCLHCLRCPDYKLPIVDGKEIEDSGCDTLNKANTTNKPNKLLIKECQFKHGYGENQYIPKEIERVRTERIYEIPREFLIQELKKFLPKIIKKENLGIDEEFIKLEDIEFNTYNGFENIYSQEDDLEIVDTYYKHPELSLYVTAKYSFRNAESDKENTAAITWGSKNESLLYLLEKMFNFENIRIVMPLEKSLPFPSGIKVIDIIS